MSQKRVTKIGLAAASITSLVTAGAATAISANAIESRSAQMQTDEGCPEETSKASEAKSNLKAIFTAAKAVDAEKKAAKRQTVKKTAKKAVRKKPARLKRAMPKVRKKAAKKAAKRRTARRDPC